MPLTRFAPSPTGELHLGHVAHLLTLQQVALDQSARVLVRMEDHDRSRCRPEYASAILSDLAWLGFHYDPESTASLRQPEPSPFRQSDHPERYQRALKQLQRVTRVYWCSCTRSDLGPPDSRGERRHNDICRTRSHRITAGLALRVELPDQEVSWEEIDSGVVSENPWQRYGDTLLRNALGEWSYQFCVVVDDLHDGVDLVIRGDDLRTSTGRQVLLASLLGRQVPVRYHHHRLLLDAENRKLSKRLGSETVAALRTRGYSASAVLELARQGLQPG